MSGRWNCPACTLANDTAVCAACDTPRPRSGGGSFAAAALPVAPSAPALGSHGSQANLRAPAAASNVVFAVPAGAARPDLGSSVQPQQLQRPPVDSGVSWSCPICSLDNPKSNDRCAACGKPQLDSLSSMSYQDPPAPQALRSASFAGPRPPDPAQAPGLSRVVSLPPRPHDNGHVAIAVGAPDPRQRQQPQLQAGRGSIALEGEGEGGAIANGWPCAACTFLNRPSSSNCSQCGALHRELGPGHEPHAPIALEQVSVAPAVKLHPGEWSCPQCTLVNSGKACTACSTKVPAHIIPADCWKCEKCEYLVSLQRSKCKKCGAPRDGAVPSEPKKKKKAKKGKRAADKPRQAQFSDEELDDHRPCRKCTKLFTTICVKGFGTILLLALVVISLIIVGVF